MTSSIPKPVHTNENGTPLPDSLWRLAKPSGPVAILAFRTAAEYQQPEACSTTPVYVLSSVGDNSEVVVVDASSFTSNYVPFQ